MGIVRMQGKMGQAAGHDVPRDGMTGRARVGFVGRAAVRAVAGVSALLLLAGLAACGSTTTVRNGEAPLATDGGSVSEGSGAGNVIDEWSLGKYPEYYAEKGRAVGVDRNVEAGTIDYSPLDSLGRAGRVNGAITYRMMRDGSDRERGEMPDPAGWPEKNPKVYIQLANGRRYHGYLYNRSHQIAKSLGGEETNENMVTGTRMQNVGSNDQSAPGGMAYTETIARNWLKDNQDGVMYYDVTPVYKDDELLPRVTYVDMLSSDGKVDKRVEVFNNAEGYDIDYRTGASTPTGGAFPTSSQASDGTTDGDGAGSGETVTGKAKELLDKLRRFN